MTLTVALSTASSVILVLIPDNLIAFKIFGLDAYGTYLFSLISLKSCINVLIYVLRNPMIYAELKRFLYYCLTCKDLNSSVTHVKNTHNTKIPTARMTSVSAFVTITPARTQATSFGALSVATLYPELWHLRIPQIFMPQVHPQFC
ncbi:hypothetical protein L596_018170 [Steinernema carpocapsae]|uniref:Uncharacterized protein n=1 Tax=Steinernema carpocapsae TaxID=34508 RepID=A0A4U5N472_STECR|nr:hypothetical protein L596_018170 [Steinernema carpocapsae]